MDNALQCREKRGEVIANMTALKDKVKGESRNFTKDEMTQFDEWDKQQEALLANAESFERMQRCDDLVKPQTVDNYERRSAFLNDGVKASNRWERQVEERNNAVLGWFLHGSSKTKPEYWRAAERLGMNLGSPEIRFDWHKDTLDPKREQRTINVSGTGNLGGDFVATENMLMKEVDLALKAYGGILNVASIFRTPTGGAMPWPTVDDTSNVGTIDTEAASIGDQNITVGQKSLGAFRVGSEGFVKASWELEINAAVQIQQLVGQILGERVGRGANAKWASGAGSTEPTGILTGLTVGQTSAANNAVSYLDVLGWFHSIDPAYRNRPGCAFMFHDSFYEQLGALLDTNGRPLLQSSLEGVAQGLPETIKRKPYYVNNSFPSFAANTVVGCFGDLSKFYIRLVTGGTSNEGGYHVVRLVERFADQGATGYYSWMLTDSLLSDAGQHPVKSFKVHV